MRKILSYCYWDTYCRNIQRYWMLIIVYYLELFFLPLYTYIFDNSTDNYLLYMQYWLRLKKVCNMTHVALCVDDNKFYIFFSVNILNFNCCVRYYFLIFQLSICITFFLFEMIYLRRKRVKSCNDGVRFCSDLKWEKANRRSDKILKILVETIKHWITASADVSVLQDKSSLTQNLRSAYLWVLKGKSRYLTKFQVISPP